METTPKSRFEKPLTLGYLKKKVKENNVPVKTSRQQTDWSLALWVEQRLNRTKNAENSVDALPRLCDMSTGEMRSWLSMFVVDEIHCQDGKPYPAVLLQYTFFISFQELYSTDIKAKVFMKRYSRHIVVLID